MAQLKQIKTGWTPAETAVQRQRSRSLGEMIKIQTNRPSAAGARRVDDATPFAFPDPARRSPTRAARRQMSEQLLLELVRAGARDAILEQEGYTPLEIRKARVAVSLEQPTTGNSDPMRSSTT